MKKKRKMRSNRVFFSLVFIGLGFIIAYSYQLANEENEGIQMTSNQWERDQMLRDQLVEVEEKNRGLQHELFEKQEMVQDIEKGFAKEEQILYNLAEDTEKYRMYLGKVKVKGQGVEVILEDSEYNPDEDSANNYIVHEHHVFQVINELFISGASAISINGQRLTHNSYIVCNGPVIEVDGFQHPAPFVISAIGDAEVMASALNLTGGVKDLLVNDNVQFSMEKKPEIVMDPLLGS
ncbi:uncharacterized protein YlxW (UPF0749 family) [Cytobacillus horneckiae]|uniref:DUF881 domain-containing protein n=1 Tax=Cytobacillus horneckiae TaxID=549687 RepID=A0A2N0ZBF5_9BACI|nr:DUF881 domain-containing protein [Cytobacillus horneckiae]NRG43470.1 DUF881 domain-containing protein [Bacillus sp. CRN 9]MBN6887069.1 DUF881 domain-containing protein [Cytobacillus horneckiae]MCM3178340.1 DUF881 domain-containing protein [Cytobacillus horneckiae]MEC1156920.1 DUF881 domain-containing protein [Cytobacillus horneckiae]MED2940054.1 DUF881 domain-containing protein [Cytobacillus horneckiae]